MSIDWKKEVEQRKDALLDDLVELLKVRSDREDDKATKDAPFGPGPKNALIHMLGYGERDGFTVKNVDNYAGHIEYGEGDETLGLFCHMDVVPAGDGWDTDPYVPVIKDNKIFARGSSDDKGPSIAAYYGLKIIKELGLPLSKKVRIVVGTDEESGWGDMEYYFKHEEKPDFGFSPDAEFPIINGEKGNVTITMHFDGSNAGSFVLESFDSGLRENMVPGTATAVFTVDDSAVIADLTVAFEEFLKAENLKGELVAEDSLVKVSLVGKGAHGASPQIGVNAGTFLATFLDRYDFAGGAKNFLHTAAKYVHLDFYGEKLGVAHEDARMGQLTMNAGILKFGPDFDDNKIALNFRYPTGVTGDSLQKAISDLLGDTGTATKGDRDMPAHYVPMDDPLVATLLQVYEDHTGEKGYEQVIGGGTFGRLLERGVAYGAMFPGYTDTMHQANEFMSLDDLFNSAVIFADAIYRLAK